MEVELNNKTQKLEAQTLNRLELIPIPIQSTSSLWLSFNLSFWTKSLRLITVEKKAEASRHQHHRYIPGLCQINCPVTQSSAYRSQTMYQIQLRISTHQLLATSRLSKNQTRQWKETVFSPTIINWPFWRVISKRMSLRIQQLSMARSPNWMFIRSQSIRRTKSKIAIMTRK